MTDDGGRRLAGAVGPSPQSMWLRPGAGLFGIGGIALFAQGIVGDDAWWAFGTLVVASGLLLLPAIWRASHLPKEQVLADHLFVLAVSFMAYSVVGALLIPLGPEILAEYSQSFYRVDVPLGMRVIAVNCIGLGLALVSGGLLRRYATLSWLRMASRFGRGVSEIWLIAAYLIVGGASWVAVLIVDIDMANDVVALGVLRLASNLLLVAIVLAAASRGRAAGLLLMSAVAMTVALSLGGFFMLNKSGILLPVIALAAGLVWKLGVHRTMIPGLVVLFGVFLLIAEPISTGRQLAGETEGLGLGERIALLERALSPTRDDVLAGEYSIWTRFCYVSAQGAALELYDMGQGGDDIGMLAWVLLPRYFFPEKPIITSSGPRFNEQITGSSASSSGQGVFANGYYNLGWWGVIGASIAVGCMLACTSAFAAEVFRTRALFWLPLALLGSLMAFRIDGHFLADYWGTFVVFSYAVLAGMILSSGKRGRRSAYYS